jgi:hypothetical protein
MHGKGPIDFVGWEEDHLSTDRQGTLRFNHYVYAQASGRDALPLDEWMYGKYEKWCKKRGFEPGPFVSYADRGLMRSAEEAEAAADALLEEDD